MVREARDRVNYLITHGHPEAQLYGVDPFENYDSLNSFYLLMDKPKFTAYPPIRSRRQNTCQAII